MTNSLMVVAKIISNTSTVFSAKNVNVFAIFQGRNFNATLTNNFVKGPIFLKKKKKKDLIN